ncbi:unnamed protein product, partial [Effrenium voratum]
MQLQWMLLEDAVASGVAEMDARCPEAAEAAELRRRQTSRTTSSTRIRLWSTDDDHLDQADANKEVPQILFDRVNPVAVEEVRSKVFRTGNGNGPTVMRICGWEVAGVLSHYVQGAIGKKGSRHAHFATSTFAQPNWLRSLLRSGRARERQQPAADSALETYFQDRERILRDTHADRAVAKQLFLRLLYGGSILAWKCSDLGSSRQSSLPSGSQQRWLPCSRLIARTTPSYLPSCGNGRRAPWSICSTPSAQERELIDKVVLLLGEHWLSSTTGCFSTRAGETTRAHRECAVRLPLHCEADDALQAAARVLRSGSPGLERMFDQVDSRWLEHHGILRQ